MVWLLIKPTLICSLATSIGYHTGIWNTEEYLKIFLRVLIVIRPTDPNDAQPINKETKTVYNRMEGKEYRKGLQGMEYGMIGKRHFMVAKALEEDLVCCSFLLVLI